VAATGRIRKGKGILARRRVIRYAKLPESPVTSVSGITPFRGCEFSGDRGKWQFDVESPPGPAYSPMADTLTQIETREKISRLMNRCRALTSSRPVMEFQNTRNACLRLVLAHIAAPPHGSFITGNSPSHDYLSVR